MALSTLMRFGFCAAFVAQIEASLSSYQVRRLHSLLDGNGDGLASLEEVTTFWSQTRQGVAARSGPGIITRMDLNKDAKVSLDEIFSDDVWSKFKPGSKLLEDQQRSERQKFVIADGNADGLLDQDEIASFFFPETHDGILELLAHRLVEMRDKSADGALSLDEFAQGSEHFSKLDTDNSGLLEINELKHWESGKFKVQEAMRMLFEAGDSDEDGHLSVHELDEAKTVRTSEKDDLDAHTHLKAWAKHHQLPDDEL